MISFDELCVALDRWQRRQSGQAAPEPEPAGAQAEPVASAATMNELPGPGTTEREFETLSEEDVN